MAKKKYVVIVEKGCPGCESLKKSMPDLNYVDIAESKDGTKLANALGVEFVPTVVSVDGKGRICVVDEKLKTVKCVRKKVSMFPSLLRALGL